MIKINFARVNPKAIIPNKRDEDAGYDIYACFEEDYINIKPHDTVMIPTGIASAFDKDCVFILKERGSTGTKGIGQRGGVIDSGYRGEWLVPITNHNDKAIVISKQPITSQEVIYYPYSKAIAQALLLPVPETTIEEISYEELLSIASNRGIGKLGSSNK